MTCEITVQFDEVDYLVIFFRAMNSWEPIQYAPHIFLIDSKRHQNWKIIIFSPFPLNLIFQSGYIYFAFMFSNIRKWKRFNKSFEFMMAYVVLATNKGQRFSYQKVTVSCICVVLWCCYFIRGFPFVSWLSRKIENKKFNFPFGIIRSAFKSSRNCFQNECDQDNGGNGSYLECSRGNIAHFWVDILSEHKKKILLLHIICLNMATVQVVKFLRLNSCHCFVIKWDM